MADTKHAVFLTDVEIWHILTILRDIEADGCYYGSKEEYWTRHQRIITKLEKVSE